MAHLSLHVVAGRQVCIGTSVSMRRFSLITETANVYGDALGLNPSRARYGSKLRSPTQGLKEPEGGQAAGDGQRVCGALYATPVTWAWRTLYVMQHRERSSEQPLGPSLGR